MNVAGIIAGSGRAAVHHRRAFEVEVEAEVVEVEVGRVHSSDGRGGPDVEGPRTDVEGPDPSRVRFASLVE